MRGYLSLVLHAHLPFVRHPEHPVFLEETWLFEAITESYLPLLDVMNGWARDRVRGRITLTVTPTLCSMLNDPLLQERYAGHLGRLIDLSEREIYRTHWDGRLKPLAEMYVERFHRLRTVYDANGRNLVGALRRLQDAGRIEIITSAATHPVLPLLENHPPSVRAQVFAGRDHYRECFGRDPSGIWLPECAYSESLDAVIREANFGWLIVDSHGLLHATPRPRYGTLAPVITPGGLAVFGRDYPSAKQVWSRVAGYPGDPRYRDFYRDIGFDLDFEYLKPNLPAAPHRSFTGIKYHAIGSGADKPLYNRQAALEAASEHASHFVLARLVQVQKAAQIMDRPPILVAPYDAELFGHWWYEGPEFLDFTVRKLAYDQDHITLITPSDYIAQEYTLQIAQPTRSSWGEGGYFKVWLNEANDWIYPHLLVAQRRMSELAGRIDSADAAMNRAIQQAGRELLLAQASDWPFMMRAGTSPEYARERFKTHLLRFLNLHRQIETRQIDEAWLACIEREDNLFPNLNCRYWAE